MAWDSSRNTLYAATENPRLSDNGDLENYRIARPPKPPGAEGDKWPTGDDAPCWPWEARHQEGYWKRMHDAGRHVICESFYVCHC